MIWEPFVLALFLGLVVSAGLYFAYLWPSVEPVEPVETRDGEAGEVEAPNGEPAVAAADSRATPESVPEPVVKQLAAKAGEPPTRPSDADMTPLPPPAPEDDGLDEKGS